MVIVALMLLSACAKQIAYGEWDWMSWMHDFMGLFLVVFSMFKFFDMEGFADGFQFAGLLIAPAVDADPASIIGTGTSTRFRASRSSRKSRA